MVAVYIATLDVEGRTPATIAVAVAAVKWFFANVRNEDRNWQTTENKLRSIRRDSKTRGPGQVAPLTYNLVDRICRTLLEILKRTQNRQPALDNPHEFASVTARIIRLKLKDQLVDGIRYEKINEWYEMSQFEAEIETWDEYLIPADNSLYDHVIFDSDVEKQFVDGLERRKEAKLYLKLPSFFTVPTPIGEYNPDWAIVFEPHDEFGEPTGEQMLYLVHETKSTTNLDKLRPDEKRKVQCGERHFKDALGVDYKVVTSADELP